LAASFFAQIITETGSLLFTDGCSWDEKKASFEKITDQ
jgi:hypothetical protein